MKEKETGKVKEKQGRVCKIGIKSERRRLEEKESMNKELVEEEQRVKEEERILKDEGRIDSKEIRKND